MRASCRMHRIVILTSVSLLCATAGLSAQGPDVIVGDLPSTVHYGPIGTTHAYAVGTTSCNVGDQNLLWISSTNEHPVIAQNLYRLSNGRFEQVGLSWLKHGFLALTQNLCDTCSGQGGSVLGVGCSDPYGASLNGSQTRLGPRFEVNATNGVFLYPFTNPAGTSGDAVFKRIQVEEADLTVPGARFFIEGHYITPDDAQAGNGLNNASYRPVSVSGSFSISNVGPTDRTKPAIQAWSDHGNGLNVRDPTVGIKALHYNEGGLTAQFLVGSKVTDNGNGTWHYEYAIQNLNSHRSAGALSIPLGPSSTALNVGFHDVDYHSGEPYDNTDWTINVALGSSVTWSSPQTYAQNPDSNALRWGTLYNFRFDSNGPPVASTATLSLFRPGTPSTLTVATLAPGVGQPLPLSVSVASTLPTAIAPGMTTPVSIQVSEGDDTLVPGSPTLHYRFGGGAYAPVPLSAAGGNVFDGLLPAPSCGDVPEFYFSAAGATTGTVTIPSDAPATVFSAIVGTNTVMVHDNFETNMGWTPQNLGASTGDWERGVPVNDPGWAYDPISDSDGSGQCWLTQNTLGNSDVDGGAVRLTSPVFDLSGGGVTIAYDYFLRLTDTTGGVDRLLVEISENGAAGPWTEIARHDTDGGLSWRHHEIDQAALNAAGVTMTATMQLRYTANDDNPQTIVESGLDAFEISAFTCGGGVVCTRGDINDDGSVNALDIDRFVQILILGGASPVEVCAGDLHQPANGGVGFEDVDDFVVCLLAAGCP